MQKLLLWLVMVAVGRAAQGADLRIDFGSSPAGRMPAGFRSLLNGGGKPGDWKVVTAEVPSAFAPLPGQPRRAVRQSVLAQVGRAPSPNRVPLLVYDKETFKDFRLTTRFEITGGALEQSAGVVFHFENESNFYAVSADALDNTFHCYKVENGVWKPPLGPGLKVAPGVWHTLAVQCDGNRILCSLDGNDAIKLVDSTYDGKPGNIGFETKADTTAYFGDTTIHYTPLVPMAQALVQSIMKKYPRVLGLRLYTLDAHQQPRVIAGKEPEDIGQAGTAAELGAITNGAVYFGRGIGAVEVTMPLRDRNGDPIAAVRVKLKSFPGETQDTAVDRARMLVRKMQAQVTSRDQLTQ